MQIAHYEILHTAAALKSWPVQMREVRMTVTEENIWPEVEERKNQTAQWGLSYLVYSAPNTTDS
jgi:hypothetical protein